MILVTGGTGLLGAHLLLFLTRKGIRVRAIYRNEKSLQKTINLFQTYSYNPGQLSDLIEWIQADITDITSLESVFEGVSKIYHTAAKVSFKSSDKEILHQTNVVGTANMVNLALEHNIQKFIHVSSIAALGGYEQPITEKTHWNWKENHSEYAVTKYLSEMEVWRASQEGLPVVIINPSVILGSGFWHEGTGKIFSNVYQGMKFYTDGSTGFVDVWDVVKAMYLLMENSPINDSFIISAYNLTFKNLLTQIAHQFNVRPPQYKFPKAIAETIWRFNLLIPNFFKLPVNKNIVHTLYNRSVYSSDKFIKKFDFHFIPFEASISNICEQFLKKQSQK